jgi:hypothetical protein
MDVATMNPSEYANRIKALSARSSYVENVLRHAFVAELSSVVWKRDPASALQVFNSEVDDAGFDIVLGIGSQMRYIQLKKVYGDKVPAHCSVRQSFSSLPGSCVVLMTHALDTLRLTKFRFLGKSPTEPIGNIDTHRPTKAPGRRSAGGEQKVREHYRDIPVRNNFRGPLSAEELVEVLFPPTDAAI